MEKGISFGLRARVSLEAHGFSFTHSLGQNFILDDNFLEDIALMSGVQPGDAVLEIGPGPGVLTRHLAAHCGKIVSLEIDRKLEPVLNDVLEGAENAEIVFQDVMKADLKALCAEKFGDRPVHVVANLPYYITADAIEKLLTCGADIEDITVMVQKEAAERLSAEMGSKSYCALAMLVQYFCNVEALCDVPPERFVPKPHVWSRLIQLTRRMDNVETDDEEFLVRVIKSAFRMRRKTLLNNLSGDFGLSRENGEALLAEMGLDARVRGEALTPDQMAELSVLLKRKLRS